MMYWGMMFGDIVAVVFFSGCPVVSELALIFSVSEPMVLHVHCLELFHDIVVDNAKGGCVVRLHWGRWLGVSHVFQCVSCWDSLPTIYVEGSYFCFCSGCHDRLDDLSDCEDCPVVGWSCHVR